MEVVQVQPRDSYLHYIYVPTKGTAIRWSFTTKRNNISFGVYRRRGQAPLPSSSEIIFRAQQQLQQRQLSAPPGELLSGSNNSPHQHPGKIALAMEYEKEKKKYAHFIFRCRNFNNN